MSPLVRVRRSWEIPQREATPEHVFFSRRKFLAGSAAAAAVVLAGCSEDPPARPRRPIPPPPPDVAAKYPAARNPAYALDRPLTRERDAAHYNNFYEFSGEKEE